LYHLPFNPNISNLKSISEKPVSPNYGFNPASPMSPRLNFEAKPRYPISRLKRGRE